MSLLYGQFVWLAFGFVTSAALKAESEIGRLDQSGDAVRRQRSFDESVITVTTAGKTLDAIRRQVRRQSNASAAPKNNVDAIEFGASTGAGIHSLAEGENKLHGDSRHRGQLRLLSRHWDRLNITAVPPPSMSQLREAAQVSGGKRLACEKEPESMPDILIQAPSLVEARCSYLAGTVHEQLEYLLGDRSGSSSEFSLAWTVIDNSYSKYALAQAQQLKSAGFEKMLFVTVERGDSLAKGLCHNNLQVLDFGPEFRAPPQNLAGDTLHWTVKLKVAKAKFVMPSLLLERRVSNLFTEMDIFWLQNPISEFESPVADGQPPSLVLGAHANNPQGPNIGAWYMPGSASKNAAQPFLEAFEIMEAFATPKNVDKPYEVFDQQVLVEVLGKRTSWAHITSPLFPRACTANSTDQWCTHFSTDTRSVYDDVLVRLLDNARISSGTVPEYDNYVLAVHVLGSAPLSAANKKVSIAKIGGVFQGTPEYYEAADSSPRRYIAWDGRIKDTQLALSYHDGTLRNPGYGMATGLPLLLKLASATGRTAILPQELDLSNRAWYAEQLFDVDRFQLLNPAVTIRESSFLHNMRLVPRNMYPVAQLALVEGQFGAQSWAGLKFIATEKSEPTVSYINLNRTRTEGHLERLVLEAMQALVDMMDDARVQTAKTVLISMPLGQVEGTKVDDYLSSACASRMVQSDSIKNLFCTPALSKAVPVLEVGNLCTSKKASSS